MAGWMNDCMTVCLNENQAEGLPCENIITTEPEIAQPRVNPWDKNPAHSSTGKAEGLRQMPEIIYAYRRTLSQAFSLMEMAGSYKSQGLALR